jgi:hypothetical protein
MMHGNLTPQGGDDRMAGRTAGATAPEARLTDREVPLPTEAAEFVALHAWLDGEVEDMPVTTAAAARQREAWRRIHEDAVRLRRLSAPPFLEQRIMQAIAAETAPVATARTETTVQAPAAEHRTITLTMPVAVLAAAACVALGAVLAIALA